MVLGQNSLDKDAQLLVSIVGEVQDSVLDNVLDNVQVFELVAHNDTVNSFELLTIIQLEN